MGEKVNLKKRESIFKREISFGSIPQLDIVLSIRHLSIMLRSSMALSEALGVLSSQAESPKLRKIYGEIKVDVESGMSMGESMRKHRNVFSHTTISIIDVGEQGGTLEKNLLFLADFLKKNYELNRKVKGALTYPIIIFLLTAFEMSGVIFFIIPKLDALFSSFDSVPRFTQIIIDITRFIRSYWQHIGAGTIIFVILFRFFLKSRAGKYLKDIFVLRMPIVNNLIRKHIYTNFSRTLGILLESSIPISEALRISSETVDNHIYQTALKEIYKEVSGGRTLSQAMQLHSDLFPATFIKMIEIGESTGTLEENLLYLHDFYAEEVTEMSNNLATLIEPILLIFIGLMIGLLAMTIVGPIYQLTGSINAN